MRIHSKPILYVHLGYYIGDVPSFSIQNTKFFTKVILKYFQWTPS